jgi:hypothetical protein
VAFTQIPNEAIDRMTELSAGAWRLYCFLVRCRNTTNGKCCPSVATTAHAIDVHPKNIFKLRKELSNAGWVRFDGDAANFLFGFKSSKNATVNVESIEDSDKGSKNATQRAESNEINAVGSKNATPSSENATDESQKRYQLVAKTLPVGSKNATPYKEEQYERTILSEQDYSGAVAPAPPPSEPERQRPKPKKPAHEKSAPPKSPFHHHPAVVAYRDMTGFKAVNAVQAALIAQATGPQVETPPEGWLKFLRELAARGSKHAHNVQVMVWAYENYEAGACLAEALDAAWSHEKGRNGSNAAPYNRGKPTLTERNKAAAEEAARLLGFHVEQEAIDVESRRL